MIGRRRGAVAGVGALAAGLAVWGGLAPVGPAQAAAPTAAKKPADGRFHKVPAGSRIVQKPLGLSNAKTTVIVQLKGDPVTVADAEAAEPLSGAQRRAHQKRLQSDQKPTASRVRALGGTVLADYQSAYNGLKVRIAQRKVADLKALPGVVSVHRVRTYTPSNTRGVPLIGAPATWAGTAGVPGLHGERTKVAIIDTGIDYTHADFGGPGTTAAYEAAHAKETQAAPAALFGPRAPKVKGGIDLVGDSYNADSSSEDYNPTPKPDPNPLDCDGHGTHVAGTAAGFGVLANGKTYRGPYKADTIAAQDWKVGPGVAPKADLYAVRVFGCSGSTDVVIDAIEWAVEHDMDVVNMSLGSTFGTADSPDAVAASNATKDGVIVVAASGNEGTAGSPYVSGSPAAGNGVLSVAASDPSTTFPGAEVALSTGKTLEAINANGEDLPPGDLPVKVLQKDGVLSVGCDPQEYVDAGVEGAVVVVQRGTCARVARAIFGQQAGAAAVIMVNNADSLPPYEGPITSNPDDGTPYEVTIPFLGVKQSDGAALIAADGGTAALSAVDLDNPGYLGLASFSSGGPRGGDSWLKPDVTAPGVSILSAGVGTGSGGIYESGTSMASPFTAGLAALVRQAHPTWSVKQINAAIANTADPAKVAGYTARAAGSGLVQAPPATRTRAVAYGAKAAPALNFGFAELGKDYVAKRVLTVRNNAAGPVTFTVRTSTPQGSPHSVTLSRSTVRVPGRGKAEIKVRLTVPAATAGTSAQFADVAGLVTLTPTGGGNAGVGLKVPYYLVPQATSNVRTKLNAKALVRNGATTAVVTNKKGVVDGVADWYAWGLKDGDEPENTFNDVKAVGAQTFPADGVMAFAVATHQRWSNAATNEFDVYVDANRDGTDDYAVIAVDYGLLSSGSADGTTAVAVFDLKTEEGSVEFFADAPTDSSALVMPVLLDQLCTTETACVSADNPRFDYSVQSFGVADGTTDTVSGSARFNAFKPSLSTGLYTEVAPNERVTESVRFDKAEAKLSPARGFLIVSHDNRADREVQLIKVKAKR